MSSFVYRCTRLDGTNKSGIIKPDADGFYEICVGALDHASKNKNAQGVNEYYSSLGADKFFSPGTLFNQRIQGGFIKAEYGHPERLPGQNDMEFMERNLRIKESQVCAVFGAIWLVPDYIDPLTGEKCIGIMAKVKPTGPYGKYLEEDLQTKGMNVCFSIRSLTTRKMIGGRNCKVLHTVVTFDYVNEPGISCAEKLVSPSCESISTAEWVDIAKEQGLDIDVNVNTARRLLSRAQTMSLENDSISLLQNTLESIEETERKLHKAFNF